MYFPNLSCLVIIPRSSRDSPRNLPDYGAPHIVFRAPAWQATQIADAELIEHLPPSAQHVPFLLDRFPIIDDNFGIQWSVPRRTNAISSVTVVLLPLAQVKWVTKQARVKDMQWYADFLRLWARAVPRPLTVIGLEYLVGRLPEDGEVSMFTIPYQTSRVLATLAIQAEMVRRTMEIWSGVGKKGSAIKYNDGSSRSG